MGWIQCEKVKWLQNNNPEVLGLVYKLTPTEEKVRKLKKVRDLWQDIMEVQEIRDVFTGQPVKKKKYDIDHFIPWSFVMNDELWNLMPMDASLNSSKSNRLPKWNPFFQNFAQNQYLMYQMIYDDMGIYNRFKGCYKDNLHSIWAGQELYRKGNSKEMFYNILEKNMIPFSEIGLAPIIYRFYNILEKNMKYGIIHKDFKRAEEYVVRKAKKISEEYM